MTAPGPPAPRRSPLSGPANPADVLAGAQAGRAVVQDFRPLAESLEWQLGQFYLQQRGSQAFLADPEPVPFVVNNDGNLSQRCAEVLFVSLAEAERHGALEPDVYVLELGVGVGLFARLFLDAFRDLCDQRGKDYYGRLCYVAADYSRRMLDDACRRGTFADHPGRYLLRVADALCPEQALAGCPVLGAPGRPPFRAVFLNYLLDCLPAAVLRRDEDGLKQLCVRTCLARGAGPGEAGLGVEELRRLAASADPRDRREPRAVAGLLVAEYDYRPVGPADLPYGPFALESMQAAGQRLAVHNYGAVRCLERVLALAGDGGLVLINDYGQVQPAKDEEFTHQRYSGATFVAVNFPLLQGYFAVREGLTWAKPEGDEEASVHARLLARRSGAEAVACFRQRFGQAARERSEGPLRQARELCKAGRVEGALPAYQQALAQQPYNWALMAEVAHHLLFGLRAAAAAAELARAGLARNPACSAELWNVLGDCLYELGRLDEAHLAFRRALRVNPGDVRAHYNLVFVHLRKGQHAEALRAVAEALALDRAGAYREDLLLKQREVLAQMEQRQQGHYRRLVDRIIAPRPPAGWEPLPPRPAPAPGAGNVLGAGPLPT
jgi:tetratricopeptide (TPR) repeat protein